MRVRRLITATVAAVAATVGLAAPAFAIDEVSCVRLGSWLRISYEGGRLTKCYANAGATNVNLANAGYWTAGNNSGWISYAQSDGQGKWLNFKHGESGWFPRGARVLYIDIR